MKQDILIEKTFTYDNIPRDLTPKGCTYDRKCGLWRINSTGEVRMLKEDAPRPEAKKCDVETGEDQKGE